MNRNNFEEIIKKLNYNKNIWLKFDELEDITLYSGKSYYSNWKHCRYLITDKDLILVKYGSSYAYGAKLPYNFSFSYDYRTLNFPPNLFIQPTEYYDTFRLPKIGDMLRITNGNKKIYGETIIIGINNFSNCFSIILAQSIKCPLEGITISFYDPAELDRNLCMNGDIVDSIYMKFRENNGKKYKNLGMYQDKIKIKDIAYFDLKLGTSLASKNYRLE